jgi:hypothetical protein
MEKNINLIFVGWIEQSETNISSVIVRGVGFRFSTQPTINRVYILFRVSASQTLLTEELQ